MGDFGPTRARLWAMERCDVAVIGAGPAGSAAATWAARDGADVVLFEKAERGRDKSCGDGLTPRAIAELDRIGVDMEGFHRIDGLRVQAGRAEREVLWPDGPFPGRGAVAPRAEFDALLMDTAVKAGADLREHCAAEPVVERGRVTGVRTAAGEVRADLVVVASGVGSPAAVGAGCGAGPYVPVRSGHSGLRAVDPGRRPVHGGLPHGEGSRRRHRSRVRLGLPCRRRDGEHRCRARCRRCATSPTSI